MDWAMSFEPRKKKPGWLFFFFSGMKNFTQLYGDATYFYSHTNFVRLANFDFYVNSKLVLKRK